MATKGEGMLSPSDQSTAIWVSSGTCRLLTGGTDMAACHRSAAAWWSGNLIPAVSQLGVPTQEKKRLCFTPSFTRSVWQMMLKNAKLGNYCLSFVVTWVWRGVVAVTFTATSAFQRRLPSSPNTSLVQEPVPDATRIAWCEHTL
ncbi:hypothetical protein FOA52_007148 [Chlamydomonas sp. UWO 241]|nr:hypothetical protein FOA52_007148 [Chlamydomonas sp. UWO 241]